MKQEELEKLSEKELLIEIYKNTQKTKRYVIAGKILSLVYIILIILPVIWLAVTVGPFLEQMTGALNGGGLINMQEGIKLDPAMIEEMRKVYGL